MELSFPLIDALRETAKKGERVMLHLHGLFNLNTYLLALSFGGKVPIVVESHDPTHSACQKFLRVRNSLRRFALRKVDRFFLSSKNESRELSDICDVSKTRIAPLPVDTNVFRKMDRRMARVKLGWNADDRYIVYVGRLEERKGLRYLIQASRILVSRFPNLHLVTVGSGPLAKELANDTTCVGQVRYEQLPTYYNAADISVLPSFRESWGRVVLESLACQTPVIATWTGCVPILMKEGVGGLFIVPVRDSIAVADRISQVLPESSALRNGIDRSKLEKYDSSNFVRLMLANYEELAIRYY
jgi:glycosyltransferase involved in cell wall biosynthesis